MLYDDDGENDAFNDMTQWMLICTIFIAAVVVVAVAKKMGPKHCVCAVCI